MKKTLLFVLCILATVVAGAQTLKVHSGAVSVAVPADDAGKMTYTGGTQLQIMGATYDIAALDSITADRSTVQPASVSVIYNGNTARVTVSADIAPLLAITVSGADVSILADATLQEEVTYTLSGKSETGSFFMDGEYKSTLRLENLTLTNDNGAAIDIANGKRIAVIIPTGTTTTLADAAGGTHKACFFVNGHPEMEGGGTLVLTGNTKHAFASDEYTLLKEDFGTLRVLKATGDGLHVEQYFEMRAGTVDIAETTGDCLDVSVTKDALDEFNGQAFIKGGTLRMDVAAEDIKGLKTDNAATISGGTIEATVSGNGTKGISTGTDLLINQSTGTTSVKMTVSGTTYMPGDLELESKCRGMKIKGNFTFDGGDIFITVTGDKAKAVSVDGLYTYKSGSINCPVSN